MLKRLAVVAVALSALLLGSAAVATPASAAVNDCTVPRFCVWDSEGYGGLPDYYWTVPTGTGGYCINFGGSLNDNVDAAVIKGGRSATLYENAGCSGATAGFLARPAYGGPEALDCDDTAAWACFPIQSGALPSSVWVIKHP